MGVRLRWTDARKTALAAFMVAIMIGAAMFVAFHELPGKEDGGDGRRVLVWDFNIYPKRQSTYIYRASGLAMEVMFPRSPHLLDMRIKTSQVDLRYEVVDLLKGPNNGAGIRDTQGIVDGNTLTFPEAFDHADLVYVMGANGVKELVVLKQRPTYLSGDLVLRSQLYYPPSALRPSPTDEWAEGEVFSTHGFTSMINTRSEEVLRIAPPFAYDSSDVAGTTPSDEGRTSKDPDRTSTTVPVETANTPLPRRTVYGHNIIEENDKGAWIESKVPWEFLSSPDTKYPVYIDPSISAPINQTKWYQDCLVLLNSNLTIVSGYSLNLYNVTLQVNHNTTNEFNINVSVDTALNIYRSVVEHNASRGTNYYTFETNGNLTIQDSYVNYTYDGIEVKGGNCSLRNVTIDHSNGDGVRGTGGVLTLYETSLNGSGGDGIDLSNCHADVLISNIVSSSESGIVVQNCFGNVSETGVEFNGDDGISVSGGSDFNVLECTVRNNTGTGIVIGDAEGLVYGNEVSGNQHGLNLTSGTNITVSGNTIDSNETDPMSNDTDGDGILDSVEDDNANHKVDVDNSTNRYKETDPLCADTDGDGIDDGAEDKDKDGIFEPDNEVESLRETNPRWQDTDNDSVSDGLELNGWNISVYFEATGEKKAGYPIVVKSDPFDNDTDDDGLFDGQEFENATHPDCMDTDGDGMSDLWELTGPSPSDPCGIEGTPPNLSELDVKSIADTWYSTEVKLEITVRARDNVGLDWIRFRIEGRGEKEVRFTQYANNTTVTVHFKADLLGSVFLGYDLNITACDRNGNAGYLEQHINSMLENFIAWVLGAVTALAKFVMELASAAIEWIWSFISEYINSALGPFIELFEPFLNLLLSNINSGYQCWLETNQVDKTISDDILSAFYSPFFWTIFAFAAVYMLIMNIIKYFLPMLKWLLFAILVFIYAIFLLKIGLDVSENDIVDTPSISGVDIASFSQATINNFLLSFISDINSNNRNVVGELLVYTIWLITLIIDLQFWGWFFIEKGYSTLGIASGAYALLGLIHIPFYFSVWVIVCLLMFSDVLIPSDALTMATVHLTLQAILTVVSFFWYRAVRTCHSPSIGSDAKKHYQVLFWVDVITLLGCSINYKLAEDEWERG